ncbi:MAG: glucuronate isomerase, partial [Anaerolineae bacterium]|nr:glucuronate isomerase [Anaerolineae bacterium]
PADLLIIPDHYVFRMLYSQGVPLEALGVPRADGGQIETDHRKIWQTFAEHYYLFRGTPSGAWLDQELVELFGVDEKLNGRNAQAVYDAIAAKLALPEYRPRALFEQFNIEVLATTDAASDTDAVVNLRTPNWGAQLAALSDASGLFIRSYADFVRALENRRAFFKTMGATATDHAAETAYTGRLSAGEAEAVFARALRGEASAEDARLFTGHMLLEMARMSSEDGLVMQLHVGSIRGHNALVRERFGADKGADIPTSSEFTHNLRPLLDERGNDPRLTLILFTLDETTYARELAPLAGHYPALRLGPPWWFHDSPNGMRRYFDQVTETAGIYNTAGFNDDTRAFCSIPARHDVWRRVACDWLAGLVARGQVDDADAGEMARELAYGLAKRSYRLGIED